MRERWKALWRESEIVREIAERETLETIVALSWISFGCSLAVLASQQHFRVTLTHFKNVAIVRRLCYSLGFCHVAWEWGLLGPLLVVCAFGLAIKGLGLTSKTLAVKSGTAGCKLGLKGCWQNCLNRPVLKHGPRSATNMRVVGWQTWRRNESKKVRRCALSGVPALPPGHAA